MTSLLYLLRLSDRHYRLVFLKIDPYQVQNILFFEFLMIQFTRSKEAASPESSPGLRAEIHLE
jgi:hypothetical protein